MAENHKFKKPKAADSKVKKFTYKNKHFLGEMNANVGYKILCKCKQYELTGGTYRV